MNLKSLFKKGKETAEERGGAASLKADADELRDIGDGEGTLVAKVKDGEGAIKEPGAPGEGR